MADDGRDAGTATAELAVAMPAVAMALVAVLGVGQVVIAQLGCADDARAGARAAARGEPLVAVRALARDGDGAVAVTRDGPLVTVSVSRTVRLLLARGPLVRLRGSAVAQVEQRPGPDRGSATVLVLALVLVCGFLATAVTGLATAVLARHRAQAAADLGALAGADVLLARAGGDVLLARAGGAAACTRAAQVARANGAGLRGCLVRGLDVLVATSVRPAGPVGRLGSARARARAGPGPP